MSSLILVCSGCIPAIVGVAVYSHTESKGSYDKYVTETQKDNTEREEHGLQPNNILSYNDWKADKGVIVTATNTNSISSK